MSMSKDSDLGTLTVVVLKAKNLIDKHSFYKQDVFAQAVLNGTTKTTPVDVKGGQHPVWDSELRFPIMKAASDKTRKLEVSCYAKESRSNDLLGKGTVDITETLNMGEFDDWVSLNIDGVVRGEVYLEMTFFSSSPRPTVVSPTFPSGQDATKRPSKLSPSERLYRLPQSPTPSPSISTQTDGLGYSGRPSPSKTKNSALPPLPETVLPSVLQAGGSFQRIPQGSSPGSGLLPLSLRPGSGNTSVPTPRPPDRARPSHSPTPSSQSSPSFGYHNSSSPNPYLPSSTPTPDTVQAQNFTTYPIPASVVPLTWDQTGTDFSFPVPSYPQPHLRKAAPYQSYGHHEAEPTVYSTPPLDPYLSARYTAPFPLPPGAEPNLPSTPIPGWQLDIKPTSDRLEALKRAEEDAIYRREQERRDLELALQLDEQLNT